MKKLFFILVLFPLFAFGQLDFESYKGKLNFVDLPAVQEVVTNPFLNAKPTTTNNSLRKLPSFRLSKDNFREPVSVFDAMAASQQYVKSDLKINIDPKEYTVYGGNSNYAPDGSTKVKNSVYKDASGFYYSDSCPPYGICPRCAPYRIGRY